VGVLKAAQKRTCGAVYTCSGVSSCAHQDKQEIESQFQVRVWDESDNESENESENESGNESDGQQTEGATLG